MAEATESIQIARSRADVWATLADFSAIVSWAPNVDHSSMATAQADGVGAVRRVQVGRNAVLERIVEWQPDERLTYALEGLPPVVKSATNTWSLSGSGDSTTATLTSTVDAGPRPPQQLIARMVCRGLAAASRQMLGGLKSQMEQQS